MRIRLIFFSLLLSGCFGSFVLAQQKGFGVQTVSKLPSKEKRWALIIGVSQYQDGNITPLPGANSDANGLRDALRDYAGFDSKQIITLTTDETLDRQPTKNNILRYLVNLKGLVPKDGLLLVAFSGHGIERQNKAFLLASDTPYNDNIKVLERTALSVSDDFKELIRDTGVGQVIILLDACRNDPSSGKSSSDNPLTQAYREGFSFDIRNKEVEAFATLYATSIGKRAYEYTRQNKGYFTWAFIEGLKGGAANKNREVTLGALIHYVEKHVPLQVAIDLGAGTVQRPFSIVEGYRADELVLGIAIPPPPIPTPTPTPTARPRPTATSTPISSEVSTSSRISGTWNFQFNISKVKNNKGFIVNKGGTVNSVIRINESGGNITGTQLGHKGSMASKVCERAEISGHIDGEKVTIVITYKCCQGSQVRFTGTIDSLNQNMTGSLEPIDIPRGDNCSMPYAEATAVKQ